MKLIKIITVLISTLFLFSCSAETTGNMAIPVTNISPSQLHKQWRLIAVDGQPLDATISSTLTITPPDKTTGNLACNAFFGTMKLQNNKFRIEKMGSTRKMCQNKVNNVEVTVSAVLSNWSEALLTENRLTLIGKTHQLDYRSN